MILLVGAWNTYELLSQGRLTWAILFGAALPLLALADYWRDRNDADRVLASLMMALVGLGIVAAELGETRPADDGCATTN
ncbi:hypothetical protein ENSA5_53700 [Enhygromyxa salina]|uniref:Uncharacterized protein n=2 Tax=Enhygromyxa salina TaxID=215803 RepID=A0A2S9XG50_9BACT|nr:hypothetical protein ENSA5_53700 [Enhygromyxa salina]